MTNDECMIVEAEIDTNDSKKVQGWEVSITDENGRKGNFDFSTTTIFDSGKGNKIMWIFVVTQASRSFTLHLPGGQTVELDSLVKK